MSWHRWIGTDAPEHDSCLTCGGMWEATDDGHQAANGDAPTACLSTSAVHGYRGERVCQQHGPDLYSDDPSWAIVCEHIRETDDCNCLFCDS